MVENVILPSPGFTHMGLQKKWQNVFHNPSIFLFLFFFLSHNSPIRNIGCILCCLQGWGTCILQWISSSEIFTRVVFKDQVFYVYTLFRSATVKGVFLRDKFCYHLFSIPTKQHATRRQNMQAAHFRVCFHWTSITSPPPPETFKKKKSWKDFYTI